MKYLDKYGKEVNDYFKGWVDKLRNGPVKAAEMRSHDNILTYFGHEHWNNAGFTCNLYDGCYAEPECHEILWHEVHDRQNRTDEEIEHHARIVYLTTLKITTLTGLMHHSYVRCIFLVTCITS